MSYKIVFSSNTSWNLWNYRYELMNALKNKGFKIHVIAPYDKFSEKLRKEFYFIPVKNLNRKSLNPFKDIILFYEYFKIFQKLMPDLVINYTIKPNLYGSLACKFLKISYINVITGLGYLFIKKSLITIVVKILYKICLNKSSKIIFQNKDDLEIFINKNFCKKSKTILLGSEGVNIEKFSSLNIKDEKPKIFLFIGRLLWDKGIREFVKASEEIKKKHPEIEFWILGPIDNDNPSGVPKEKINEWVKKGIVKYLGFKEDVRPYIAKSSAIILPSYKEGMPRSLIEAIVMGKPIITTDVPGCRDICINGKNGFLIPPKNVKLLISTIEKFILLSSNERKSLSYNSRLLGIEKFNSIQAVNRYLKVIEEILEKKIRKF